MEKVSALNGIDFSPEINMVRYLQKVRTYPILSQDEEYTTVYAPQSEYSKIRAALVEAFGEIEFEEDETTWLASEEVELTDPEDIRKFRKFMDAMDDNDDVQNVYHNAKIVE